MKFISLIFCLALAGCATTPNLSLPKAEKAVGMAASAVTFRLEWDYKGWPMQFIVWSTPNLEKGFAPEAVVATNRYLFQPNGAQRFFQVCATNNGSCSAWATTKG